MSSIYNLLALVITVVTWVQQKFDRLITPGPARPRSEGAAAASAPNGRQWRTLLRSGTASAVTEGVPRWHA